MNARWSSLLNAKSRNNSSTIFSDEPLFYNGYEVRKLTEKVNYGHKNEVEVSYAVVRDNDFTRLKFDGVYFAGALHKKLDTARLLRLCRRM